MEQLAWVMGGLLILIGVAGCVLPVLPGFGLIFVGALLHKLVIPDGLSWWMVGLAGLCVPLGALIEWLASAVGVKLTGGSRYGMMGALVGGLVGLFFLPVGLFVGPVMGALLAESLLAKRAPDIAAKAALGVVVGMALSVGLRFALAISLAVALFWDALTQAGG
jgi:uncharacterized protein YqgC (DUF456 family)